MHSYSPRPVWCDLRCEHLAYMEEIGQGNLQGESVLLFGMIARLVLK